MTKCYLCNLQSNKNYVFWENDILFAAFDNNPVSPGHTLLFPKRHTVEFKDLSTTEWIVLQSAIKEVLNLIQNIDLKKIYKKFIEEHETDQSVWFCKKALESLKSQRVPDAYNHGFNDGKTAGRTVDHFHWHIIPRYKRDMIPTQGGIRFVIPDMGDYSNERKL